MTEETRLTRMILSHWQNHHPKMLAQLRHDNLLEVTLRETEQQMSDLLYDLLSVRKMEYTQAWEIVVNAFLPPPAPSSTTSLSPCPPATSG